MGQSSTAAMRASLFLQHSLELVLTLLSICEVKYLEIMGKDEVETEGKKKKNKGRGGDPDTEFQYVAPFEGWVI